MSKGILEAKKLVKEGDAAFDCFLTWIKIYKID